MTDKEPNFARALLKDPRVNVFLTEMREKRNL